SSQELARRSPVSLEVKRGSAPVVSADRTAPVVVVHKRSVLWPLLALVTIGIAAVALYLVWKQREAPGTIIVTQSKADVPPAGSPESPAPPPAGGAPAPEVTDGGGGGGGARPGSVRPRSATSGRPADPYTAVVTAHRPQLSKCMTDNPLPTGTAKVNVKVQVVV